MNIIGDYILCSMSMLPAVDPDVVTSTKSRIMVKKVVRTQCNINIAGSMMKKKL